MDKIINLEDRLERKRREQKLEKDRSKLEAIQKVIQCSSCHFRCAMCGIHVHDPDLAHETAASFGFPFCESCKSEFEDYLSILDGEDPEVFWHNSEWVKMWSTWLDYRKSIKDYMDSSEFKRLLD